VSDKISAVSLKKYFGKAEMVNSLVLLHFLHT